MDVCCERGGIDRAISAGIQSRETRDLGDSRTVANRDRLCLGDQVAALRRRGGREGAADSVALSCRPRSQDGWTPLQLAAEFGYFEMVVPLIERRANVEARTDVSIAYAARPLHA